MQLRSVCPQPGVSVQTARTTAPGSQSETKDCQTSVLVARQGSCGGWQLQRSRAPAHHEPGKGKTRGNSHRHISRGLARPALLQHLAPSSLYVSLRASHVSSMIHCMAPQPCLRPSHWWQGWVGHCEAQTPAMKMSHTGPLCMCTESGLLSGCRLPPAARSVLETPGAYLCQNG